MIAEGWRKRPRAKSDRRGPEPAFREGGRCLCGCKGSFGRCRRSRTKRSRPERLDAFGTLELQCKRCANWWPLACFPRVGPSAQTRHGVRPECNECRLRDLEARGWYNAQRQKKIDTARELPAGPGV